MCPIAVPSKFTVAIAPLGHVSPWRIKFTTLVLKRVFGIDATILPEIEIPPHCFIPERNRYRADYLLKLLFTKLPFDTQRILGIIESDLETKTTQPCLGLAGMRDGVALYSAQPPSSKEGPNKISEANQDYISYHLVVHEFGHTLGLKHCDKSKCAMRNKSADFFLCDICQKWADRELKVLPGSAEERFARAESLFKHGFVQDAVKAYYQAVAKFPQEPLYRFSLGLALEKSGKINKASEEIKMALELLDDPPSGYNYSLGLISLINNQPEEAEKDFAKTAETAKDPKFMYRLIGQAYREITHDVERASRHYKEYLRLGGDDPDVIEWLISRGQLDKT